jgi:hypothetical protein
MAVVQFDECFIQIIFLRNQNRAHAGNQVVPEAEFREVDWSL